MKLLKTLVALLPFRKGNYESDPESEYDEEIKKIQDKLDVTAIVRHDITNLPNDIVLEVGRYFTIQGHDVHFDIVGRNGYMIILSRNIDHAIKRTANFVD